ncbi:MAG: Nucleoside triphosphatase NudI [Verrucomicrobiales bacterium]|nr:Nucleoside triphosphatase NudI [Verrucomicrobiales bacterium]
MIRNIIFDWSGTLVDDLPAVLEATNYVFAQCGLKPLTLAEFRAEFCLPFTKFYDRYIPGRPMAELEGWFHGRFKQVQDNVVALPHAQDFLEFCRQHKIRTFLLSTVHTDHWVVQAKATDLGKFIDVPYSNIWDKREKIHDILRENQLDPQETLFIGDMQHDVETAKHGGIFSCAVLTGYNRLEQLRAAEPDLICEHLRELREILERNHFNIVHRVHGVEVAVISHPIATVGALIFNPKNEMLMVRTHKWSDMWGIPGGKIKFGETSLDALRREIKEETDLEIDGIEFVLVQDCIHSKEFYREAHFVLLNYLCRTGDDAQVKLNEEAQEFRWVSLEQAMQLDLNTPTKILLEAVKQRS